MTPQWRTCTTEIAAKRPGMSVALRAEVLAPAATRTRPVILIAEDDPDLRDTLSELLAVEGLPIVGVSNGHLLVSCVVESLLHPERFGRIGLIISDILMPGISGLEAMARIRRCRVDTPLVLMTGQNRTDVEPIAATVGAAAVLQKPFGYAEIAEWVHKLVPAPVRDH